MAEPLNFATIFFLALVLMVLMVPALMRSHYAVLIASWNATIIVFFLPGQPLLGTVMSMLSLGMFLINRTLRQKTSMLVTPSITWPLMFLLLVVVVTAKLTGGISSRALGGETWGGRRYLLLFGAIAGYYALISQAIPKERRQLYAGLFFLSGVTAVVSDLVYAAGPSFYFLYLVFPSHLASLQVLSQENLMRLSGFTWASQMAVYFMLARYGLRGVFDFTRPWRVVFFFTLVAVGTLGGFRSALILTGIVFITLFIVEGLVWTRFFPAAVLSTLLLGAFLVAFVDRLPLAVQRSLSFLPIEIDPIAKMDAMGTLDWRLQMWKTLVPEVPKYFLLGKGFAFSGTDYMLTQEAIKRGFFTSFEDTLVSGNYHNGILTILIPFGIFGLVGFGWFCTAALRILYANFRHGDLEIRNVNTFLLAFFIARLFFYFVFYGQFDLDFNIFTGVIGLSIALNSGIAKPSTSRSTEPAAPPTTKVLASGSPAPSGGP
jgi:hypothetical protein